MARPAKATIEYFSHYVNHGKTLFTIETKYGNDGYAFWFKLLELLGSSDHHFVNCNNLPDWEFLLAKTRCNEETAENILNTLSALGAIDEELWANKIIRSNKFIDNLDNLYSRRRTNVVTNAELLSLCKQKPFLNNDDVNKKPQSKVKKSKEEKRKEEKKENFDAGGIFDLIQELTEKRVPAMIKNFINELLMGSAPIPIENNGKVARQYTIDEIMEAVPFWVDNFRIHNVSTFWNALTHVCDNDLKAEIPEELNKNGFADLWVDYLRETARRGKARDYTERQGLLDKLLEAKKQGKIPDKLLQRMKEKGWVSVVFDEGFKKNGDTVKPPELPPEKPVPKEFLDRINKQNGKK